MKPSIKLAIVTALASISVAGFAKGDGWVTSYPEALKLAKETGKPILADFTGSDWCGWCIRLHREVFDKPEFKKWAQKSVVLLELDFPHRTPQPDALRRQNRDLAQKYGVQGFPSVYFLNSEGRAFGMYGYDYGGPVHWTEMADRLLKKTRGAAHTASLKLSDGGYPTPVSKKLYAENDLRGKPAPKFTVAKWLSGVAPQTKGKVVLLDFWATWCPPCRELIPELNTWRKQFAGDLVVIGISDESPATVEKFMKTTHMDYNVAVDPKGVMEHAIGIQGIPHCLIVTPDNVVRWQGFPQTDEDPLTDKVIQQIIDASKKQSATKVAKVARR